MRTAIMATLFHILSLLGLVAYGCPPPFNDFDYANNDTLLREKITQYKANPQLGWAHVIGGTSPVKTWPANQQGKVIIPYCWADAWSQKKFKRRFQQAWLRWSIKIGLPSAQSGHCLGGFQEVTDEHGESVFCYGDEKHMLWKKSIPDDTLVIKAVLNSHASYASLGYTPKEWLVRTYPVERCSRVYT